MKLKSFSYLLSLIIIFYSPSLLSEEKIDIWQGKEKIKLENTEIEKKETNNNINRIESSQKIKTLEKIKIEEGTLISASEKKVYGIFEPADYNLSLNMWSATKAEDLKSSLKRLNKIKLSKSSNEILEMILFSFSYPPKGMTEKEFVNLKISWLIKNDRVDLIESFLKQNEDFEGKSKVVQ